MKALLFTAVTVCLLGVAVCCGPPFGPPPPATTSPPATPCPPGVSQVNCFTDPCASATCDAHPRATCEANYCGGCNAIFYDSNDNEVSCDDPYCPSGGQYIPNIFCGRGLGREDCPSTHSCQTHPADRWAVCCPATVGVCPDTTGMVGTCVEECSSDSECAAGEKCCSNGCGHVCMDVTRR